MINNTIADRNTQAHSHGLQEVSNLEQSFGQFSSTSSAHSFPPDLLQNIFKLIQSLISQLKNRPEQEPNQKPSSSEKYSPASSAKEEVAAAKVPTERFPVDPFKLPELNVDNSQKQRLVDAIFPQFKGVNRSDDTIEIAKVADNNNDGKLSAGDTIKIIHDNGEAPEGTARRVEVHTLTQDEVDRYVKSGNEPERKVTQAKVPTELFPIDHEPEGKVTQAKVPTELFPIDPIKLPVPSLSLSDGEKKRLSDAIIFERHDITRPADADPKAVSGFAISDQVTRVTGVTDNNLDGKLSVGDTVKLITTNGEGPGRPVVEEHKLTQRELNRYNNDGSANPRPATLTLTDAQTELVKDVYNFEVIKKVDDNDRSGGISAGDTISGKSTADARVGFEYTVNADQAKHMNGEFGSKLSLSDDQTKVLNKEFNLDGERLSLGGVLDSDGNGKLSEGDMLYARAHLVKSAPPAQYHQITAENIHRSESTSRYGNELPVTEEQQKNTLNEVFGIIARDDDKVRIHDKDGIIKVGEGSGIIKAGDTAVLYSSQRIADKNTVITALTQDDVFDIQHGKAAPLSNEQHQRALESFFTASDSDKVRISDKDGDGKVSAGDTALLYSPSRIENRVTVVSTLSESDARRINGE